MLVALDFVAHLSHRSFTGAVYFEAEAGMVEMRTKEDVKSERRVSGH